MIVVLSFFTQKLFRLIGAKGTRLLWEKRPADTGFEEAHLTPHGKRVSVVEINHSNTSYKATTFMKTAFR